MSRDVNSDIRRIFHTMSWTNCWRGDDRPDYNNNNKFMEIPLKEVTFEIPLFAFSAFTDIVNLGADREVDAIVVNLFSKGNVPSYKSVDRYMRDVLTEKFTSSRLVQLKAKQGDNTVVYYGTQGAVFDRNFSPIMFCSYQIEKYLEANEGEENDSLVKYKIVRPILRISRSTFLEKGDPIQKYVANKMVNAFLEDRVLIENSSPCPRLTIESPMEYVKIEIDDFPFEVKAADVPSISTTNKKLLDVALNHLDELIQ